MKGIAIKNVYYLSPTAFEISFDNLVVYKYYYFHGYTLS